MTDAPEPLEEATLRRALVEAYGISAADLTADRDGADARAWSYRVRASDGSAWFVKVRPEVRPGPILVPRFLRDAGHAEVVASISTGDGAPWLEIGPWSVLVSPLVDGAPALRVGLEPDGWRRLGAFAARLHAVRLPTSLEALVPREAFRPKATTLARDVDRRIARGMLVSDELGRAVIGLWRERRSTILDLAGRADELYQHLRERRSGQEFVLCHADLHIGNVLVARDGALTVVDWDEITLAPRERDLMFVRGSAIAEAVTDIQADAFEDGYGRVEVDTELIAFYRIDWAVQDLAGFADEVLQPRPGSSLDRARAARLFAGQFDPGNEVDTAIAAAGGLRHR